MTNPDAAFVETREYKRFQEFCDACRRYRYIGLCYGRPGVGKTLSARHFADWDRMESYNKYKSTTGIKLQDILNNDVVLYTAHVVNSPGQINNDITSLRQKLRDNLHEDLYRKQEAKVTEIESAALQGKESTLFEQRFATWTYLDEQSKHRILSIRNHYAHARTSMPDPTTLIIIDEADRLKMAALDQVRDIFDHGGIGVVLIGMPGLEKRLARYPQFYSRIGFVHEYRPLSQTDVRALLEARWRPEGVTLPPGGLADAEGFASIIRETQGNFRLLHRLLTQVGRVLEINQLDKVTREVVEAARESLVIGN